jgi:ribonuclease BN (tRNA processing enzyme)
MPELVFIGTGEAFDPDLPNTSLLYRGSSSLLMDCGYSVPEAFWRKVRNPELLDGVYLSHRHADHTFGVPGLLYWMKFAGRTRPIALLGGPELEPWVTELLDFAYPGSFGESFFPLPRLSLQPGVPTSWGALELTVALSQHGATNASLCIKDQGVKVCYSGDGGPTLATRELYRGAQLLVHECFAPSHPELGHADAATLLSMADELGVQTLALVHVGREHKQLVRQFVDTHRARCRVILPRPGERIDL